MKLSGEAIQFDRAVTVLESRSEHRCIGIRNAYIQKRIVSDFAGRQSKLCHAAGYDARKYNGSVEVLPACASAFRDLLNKKNLMPGFPSKPYTGVPGLVQWLKSACLSHREEHLDSLLCRLQRLLHGIKYWSDDDLGRVAFSKRDIEKLLRSSHEKYRMVS